MDLTAYRIRRRWLVLIALAALAGPLRADDYDQRADQLSRMTPLQRDQVRREYDRFKKLPADEQERLRKLSQQLEQRPPAERRRLIETMDRYHRWLDNLPAHLRKKIRDAPPNQRFDEVMEAYQRESEESAASQPGRPGHGPLGFWNLALKIWDLLTPKQRDDLRAQPASKRHGWIIRYARQLHMLPSGEEATKFAQAQPPAIRKWLNGFKTPQRRQAAIRELYLDQALPALPRPLPEPATDALLKFFTTELPPWLRDDLAMVSAGDARRATIALYYIKHPEKHPRSRHQPGPAQARK